MIALELSTGLRAGRHVALMHGLRDAEHILLLLSAETICIRCGAVGRHRLSGPGESSRLANLGPASVIRFI